MQLTETMAGVLTIEFVIPFILFSIVMIVTGKFQNPLKTHATRLKSGLVNTALFFGNGILYGFLFVSVATAVNRIAFNHLPRVDATVWDNMPLPLSVFIAIVLIDFNAYWIHRLLHTKPFWGIHAVHHSDMDMTWTTTHRVHVFEGVIMAVCSAALVTQVTSLPAEVLGIAGIITGLHNKYVHCQVPWTHGPLRYWIISPNNHRWHHADTKEAYDCNFGDVFVIWDRMFGTLHDPEICREKIGLPDGPHNIVDLYTYPFKYWAKTYGQKKKDGQTPIENPTTINNEISIANPKRRC